MTLTLFSGRGLAFLRGMALGKLPSSDACRQKAMIVAVAVVVIAGELVLSLYLISISTYAGLREQRARGRNVSHLNAASGSICRFQLAFKVKATYIAVGGI